MQVVEPSFNPTFVGTTDAGVYLTEDSGSIWTARNTGLSGGDLLLRSLRLHPAYTQFPLNGQHLWACTENGLAHSADGGATWTTISKATLGTPTNTAGDSPAPATGDLDQIDLW